VSQLFRRQVLFGPLRPKFDFKAGTYHCSGYRDDTDFHNCHTTYQKHDITRDTWDN
jgi:hypothetical protein